MKKSIVILLMMGITYLSSAQSKSVETLYNKYKSDKEFFHMDLAGNFLNFAEGMNLNLDEGQMSAITKSVERVKLFKVPVNGSVAKADYCAAGAAGAAGAGAPGDRVRRGRRGSPRARS